MANVNITGIQIGDNTYYPRRVYDAGLSLDFETGNIAFNITDCTPIDGLSIIIRFRNSTIDETDNYNGIKYVWTDLGLIPIKYMNINQPYLYFNEHDMAEFVFRGSGDTSVCELVSYPHNMIPITYNNLKDERDNGRLIPGMQYRIIDYVTECYYTATSAGHPFDIVVTALDNSTLDENAKAMKRDGDEYFANCDLNKWEIKYTLDADPERFEWAKNGDEVEYKTYFVWDTYEIESYSSSSTLIVTDANGAVHNIFTNNVYTFDGVQYYATNHPNTFVLKNGYTPGNYMYVLEVDSDISGTVHVEYPNWIDNYGNKYYEVGQTNYFISSDSTDRSIYEIYKEHLNRYEITNIEYIKTGGSIITILLDSHKTDLHLDSNNKFCSNGNIFYKLYDNSGNMYYVVNSTEIKIGGVVDEIYDDCYPYIDGYEINNYPKISKGIIYHMKDEWGNECPYDFKNIMFKIKGFETVTNNNHYYTFTTAENIDLSKLGVAVNNIIKPYISTLKNILNNIILFSYNSNNYCHDNIFDYNCRNICIGCLLTTHPTTIKNNTFGCNCYDINVVQTDYNTHFYDNTFGSDCESNTFGGNCYRNTFGNRFYSNTFGNNCYGNTFGNNCYSNRIGSCYCNTFGNNCYGNIIGMSSGYNTFGNNCSNNTFGDTFQYNILMNYVRSCNIKQGASTGATNRSYCQYNTFNTGVQSVTLVASGSLGSSYVTKNIVVHSDLNSASTKYINVSTNKETVTNVYYKAPTTVKYAS